jgi:uncharacterized repeat protein (TIGR02543 family)
LTARTQSGSTFVGWSGGSTSTDATITFTVTENEAKAFTAKFQSEQPDRVTVLYHLCEAENDACGQKGFSRDLVMQNGTLGRMGLYLDYKVSDYKTQEISNMSEFYSLESFTNAVILLIPKGYEISKASWIDGFSAEQPLTFVPAAQNQGEYGYLFPKAEGDPDYYTYRNNQYTIYIGLWGGWDVNGIKYKITHSFDDGKIHISLPLWKLKLIESDSLSEMNRSFGCELYDEDIIAASEKLGFLYCYDIYVAYSTTNNAYPYLLLPLSAICLLADFFFVFFVYQTKNKWYQKTKCVFQRNGLSATSLNLGILLVDGIGALMGILLSVFLYIFAFIPHANEHLMKTTIPFPPAGYYYYSQQPKNPYYDSINKPMEVITFEPLILVMIFAVIAMVLLNQYMMTKSKKE